VVDVLGGEEGRAEVVEGPALAAVGTECKRSYLIINKTLI